MVGSVRGALLGSVGCMVVVGATLFALTRAAPGRGRGQAPIQGAAERPLPEALAALTGAKVVAGNAVEVIEDGAIFDAMERELRTARQSLHIVMFIWRGAGDPSRRIGRAVLDRAPGVACRILLDPFGSLKFDRGLEADLVRSGCEVRRYDRPSVIDPFARNHRKIVVVDGRVAITGGFGIWTSWEGEGRTPQEWRDTSARVRGPVVAQLQRAFEQSWVESGGAPLPRVAYPALDPEGATAAAFVASSPRRDGPSAAEVMTHLLVAEARRRIWIANSYFIPDAALQDLLIARRRRGVDVVVLAPGPVHDVAPVRAAQRATYARLLAAGVRIYEYQPSMMHSKTMIIDDTWVVIGSTNIDALSFDHLEEGSLVVAAPALARRLARHFSHDLGFSKEITPAIWSARDLVPEIGRRAVMWIEDWL